jgi:DNA-binding transcriptional ArsR family regulator
MTQLVANPATHAKAALFRAFAEPSRLHIVEALRAGPRTVTEICDATGLTQPNASNHLACLLGCGLVARRPMGRFVQYRLVEGVEALLGLVDEVALDAGRGRGCCPVCGSKRW